MTNVINIRSAPANWKSDPNYIYIGRKGKGQDGYFGNPVAIGKICPICGKIHLDGGSTLTCYKIYFEDRLKNDHGFEMRIMGLRYKTLVCFCIPKPCHGTIMAEYVNNAYSKLGEIAQIEESGEHNRETK